MNTIGEIAKFLGTKRRIKMLPGTWGIGRELQVGSSECCVIGVEFQVFKRRRFMDSDCTTLQVLS